MAVEYLNDEMIVTETPVVTNFYFAQGETTEWSAVFDQKTGEAVYCHRENYDKKYTFSINGQEE